MVSSIKRFLRGIGDHSPPSAEQFQNRFLENLATCSWEPHPRFSVFTQYDQEWYLADKEAFMLKYRSFYAVSKTVAPRRIIELGTCAGASGDAYLSAAPKARYLGFDLFGVNFRRDDGSQWNPYRIAEQLFTDRGFKKWQLIRVDLRTLDQLPKRADFVVVDAAHDFDNEYADLQLALTANPTFIFVDDAADEAAVKPAIEKFLSVDLKDRVAYTYGVSYVGGGLVIKLK